MFGWYGVSLKLCVKLVLNTDDLVGKFELGTVSKSFSILNNKTNLAC